LSYHKKRDTFIYLEVNRLEKQNVTISVSKDILRKAKHIAIDRQTSLSRLLADALEDIVEREDRYGKAKARQQAMMKNGFNLGVKGKISWKREDLHAR
jgi:predicted transcriptional regulator